MLEGAIIFSFFVIMFFFVRLRKKRENGINKILNEKQKFDK